MNWSEKDQQVMLAATEAGLSDREHYLKHGETAQGMTVINVLESMYIKIFTIEGP